MKPDFTARSHVGCRRKLNEDAVLARDGLNLWVVADGMGGHDAGEVASQMVIEALSALPPALDPLAAAEWSRQTLLDVNSRLRAMADARPGGRTIGCTVVALSVDDASFTCLWAGDSRAYRIRNAAMAQLTHDHSLVQRLVDLGEIDQADADSHPNANVITRAVGAGDALDLDLVQGDIMAGDIFLIASDGLTRVMNADEICAATKDRTLDEAADDMLNIVLDRGAPDNVSLVLVQIPPA